ncbi:MAG: HypC/HybG/HupF family hydrogenase formation chaperone [Fidelibacterota bacterium]
MCLAVPVKVVDIQGNIARVELSGNVRDVNISLLEEVKVGDYVIVHVGYAIQRLDEDEALKTLKLFEEIEEAYEKRDDGEVKG